MSRPSTTLASNELTAHRREAPPVGPSAAATITALKAKVEKLLVLCYADKNH